MKVAATNMASDVRVAIDMNRTNKQLITAADQETLLLNDIIESKLCDAIRLTELECPVSMLESGIDCSDRTHDIDSSGRVSLQLPSDFMRMVALEMSDWKKPVYDFIDDTDPAYSRLQSPWRGIAGSPEQPAAAIRLRATGKVVEGYTSGAGATIEMALYRALPSISTDGYVEVSSLCYRSAVYRAAYLTLLTVGDEQAAAMLETAKSLLV